MILISLKFIVFPHRIIAYLPPVFNCFLCLAKLHKKDFTELFGFYIDAVKQALYNTKQSEITENTYTKIGGNVYDQ